MRPLSRIALLVVAGLVAATLVAPTLAAAHVRRVEAPAEAASHVAPATPEDARPVSIAPAAPAPRALWPLAVPLALVALALSVVARRRAFRIALVVLIAVFTVETGVHSVHHLADRQAATHCGVFMASAHVQGASVDAPTDALWVPVAVGTVAVAEPGRPGARPLRPDEGRAPPA
jgi:hypothetical protein